MQKSGKTAKELVATTILSVHADEKIGDVRQKILRRARELEVIEYVYVVDGTNTLRGVISVKDVFKAPQERRVGEIMVREPVAVHPLTHAETVAHLALKHEIAAVPVVDKAGRLLGAIPYHTILRTLHNEMREDIFRFAGLHHKIFEEVEIIKAPATKLVRVRLPWLVLGVVGGMAMALVVSFFESVLSAHLILAAFMPVLVYLSDAVGTQSETLIVRSIALDPKLSIKTYLCREFIVVGALALACGTALAALSFIGVGSLPLAAVVGLSMFLSINASGLSATILPLVLKKFGFDPAAAAGPFATILSDVCTIIIYFVVASALLGFLGPPM